MIAVLIAGAVGMLLSLAGQLLLTLCPKYFLLNLDGEDKVTSRLQLRVCDCAQVHK
jgi:hypothetical protein